MRPPRVTIAGMMLYVVAAAVGLASLLRATDPIAAFVVLATLLMLTLAVLGIAYRRDARRAFWVGFALLGWGYLAITATYWWPDAKEPEAETWVKGRRVDEHDVRPPRLLTTLILDDLRPRIHLVGPGTEGRRRFSSMFSVTTSGTARILTKLDKPIPMPFADETPLDEVLEYVRNQTADSDLPGGIPIYVDPVGLQSSENSLGVPVSFRADGIPLRRSLAEMLRQLKLGYSVSDGLLTITSLEAATRSDVEIAAPFFAVGHCELALLFALAGGLTARLLHDTQVPVRLSQGRHTTPGESPPPLPKVTPTESEPRPGMPEIAQ